MKKITFVFLFLTSCTSIVFSQTEDDYLISLKDDTLFICQLPEVVEETDSCYLIEVLYGLLWKFDVIDGYVNFSKVKSVTPLVFKILDKKTEKEIYRWGRNTYGEIDTNESNMGRMVLEYLTYSMSKRLENVRIENSKRRKWDEAEFEFVNFYQSVIPLPLFPKDINKRKVIVAS